MPVTINLSVAANVLLSMSRGERSTTPLVCVDPLGRVSFHPASTYFTPTREPHPKLVYFISGGCAGHVIQTLGSLDAPSPGLELVVSSSANLGCQLPPPYLATEHAQQFLLVSAFFNATGHNQALDAMVYISRGTFPTSRIACLSTAVAPERLFFLATGDAAGRFTALLKSPVPTPLGIEPIMCTDAAFACKLRAPYQTPEPAHQFLLLSATHNAAGHLLALLAWMDYHRGPSAPYRPRRMPPPAMAPLRGNPIFTALPRTRGVLNPLAINRPQDLLNSPALNTADGFLTPSITDRSRLPSHPLLLSRPRGSLAPLAPAITHGSPAPPSTHRERVRLASVLTGCGNKSSASSSTTDSGPIPLVPLRMDHGSESRASSLTERRREPPANLTTDHAGESPADIAMHYESESPLSSIGSESLADLAMDLASELPADSAKDHENESPYAPTMNPANVASAHSTVHDDREPSIPPFTDIDAAIQLMLLSRSDAAAGALLALARGETSNAVMAISDNEDDDTTNTTDIDENMMDVEL